MPLPCELRRPAELKRADALSSSRPGLPPFRAALMSGAMAAMALALSGCASTGYPSASVAEANTSVDSGYAVAAGDNIKITVFDEPSLTGEFQVDSSGDLAMPLIEKVSVTGKTPNEVAQAIGTELKSGGYVLDRHGAPRRGIHAMQLEICRSTYLDAQMREAGPRFMGVARLLGQMVRALAAQVANTSSGDTFRHAAE